MSYTNKINSIVINTLSEKQTVKSLTQHVLALAEILEQSLTAPTPVASHKPTNIGRKPRDYGPNSTRKATRFDAWEILFGDRANQKARQIADETGLSRGQVYSIQGGYTFRDVAIDEFDNHNDRVWTANFVGPIAA